MRAPKHSIASCTRVLLVAVAAALLSTGCSNGHDGWSGHGSTSDASTEKSAGVISAKKFGPCISKIDVADWKVEVDERDPARQGRADNTTTWRISWNDPSDGEEPDDPRVATAVILPTANGAEKFRDLFPKDDNAEGKLPETRNNLFLLSSNGDVYPELPKAAVAGLERCAKAATIDQAQPKFAGNDFSECKVPDIDPNAIVVEEIYVRGLDCSDVTPMVKKGATDHKPWCSSFGADEFSCASENICCSVFALYAGSSRGEVVVKYGI